MEEILDIFDGDMNWTGTDTRKSIHRNGTWHQTFHCWVLHRTNVGDFLLLQRRHSSKDILPNLLDVSCAGHLEAGEAPEDGIRELKEELGLEVNASELHKIGVYRYSFRSDDVQDNEFCHVFIVIQNDATIHQYRPALGEVSGLYLIATNELHRLVRSEINAVTIHGFDYDNASSITARSIDINRDDLVMCDESYYQMLFAKLSDL